TARRHLGVDPLECSPAPAVVVRGAENQSSTGLKYTLELAEDFFVRGHMLDHLRTDHAVERRVLEGKLEDRAVYQRIPVTARVSKFAEDDVQPDQPTRADDAARPAADVQNPPRAGGQLRNDGIAPALPVTLQGYEAVVGARVVVRRGDRVSQLPHCSKRLQVGDGEARQPGMRLPGQPSPVMERHLPNGESGRDRSDQDLFEDVEIGSAQRQRLEGATTVQAVAARKVGVGQRKASLKDEV